MTITAMERARMKSKQEIKKKLLTLKKIIMETDTNIETKQKLSATVSVNRQRNNIIENKKAERHFRYTQVFLYQRYTDIFYQRHQF